MLAIANENLLKPLQYWSKSNGGSTTEITDTFTLSEDGVTASFTITHESSYIYYNVDTATLKGHPLKLTFAEFSSSDGKAWLQIRFYDSTMENYTRFDKKQEEGDFVAGEPAEFKFECPADCPRIRVCIRHEYASQGISPPATIVIRDIRLADMFTESLTALNFHKVLKENLPASVQPGSQHIYFTTDGVTAGQYIANKEGYLIPVGAAIASGGGEESEYTNAYTQQWINERKDEILALTKQGHCIVFAIATDIHVRIEDGDAGRYNQVRDYLMLSEQLPMDYICCCGDIMSYCQEWDGVFEPRIEKVKEIFQRARCPWFATRGNHDYNSDDNNPGGSNPNIKEFDKTTADTYLITNDIWHRSIPSQFPSNRTCEIVFDRERPTYGYFYVDDYSKKHRLIFTNSEETHETELGTAYLGDYEEPDCFISGAAETKHQITWLVNQAMDMTGKTDWVVSFYSHTVPYTDREEETCHEFHGYGWDSPELRRIVKAFQDGTSIDMTYGCADVDTHTWVDLSIQKDFRTQGPIAVLGWFGGHCHDDCYRKIDGLNINISTCTCASRRDKWSQDPDTPKLPPERNSSNYAMSVNVFVVNRNTRTIHMIKVGSKRDNAVKFSSDLEFTY